MKQTPLVRSRPLGKKRAKGPNAILKEQALGRTLTRQQLIKLCDPLWSKLVKLHANGKCELCGEQAIDSHHMVSRRHAALRFQVENGMALCRRCHLNFHNKEALTAWEFMRVHRSGSYATVRAWRYSIVKHSTSDMRDILDGLKEQLKGFE